MSLALAAAAAGASALAYATAGVLQHRAAQQAPAGSGVRLGLMASLVRRPLWLAGIGCDGAALALHVVALSAGTLDVVQPLMVAGLLFALPASALIERRRPSLAEWAWAAALTVGLAAFLLAARPGAGGTSPSSGTLAVVTAGVVAACAPLLLAAQRAPQHRAALLGAVAGTAYGLTAALIKGTTTLLGGPHPVSVLTTWPLYLLVGVGAAALVVSQAAFQAGPLAASLPPLTIIDPVLAVGLGTGLFGERVAASPLAVTVEAAGAAVMVVAIVQLARRSSGAVMPGP